MMALSNVKRTKFASRIIVIILVEFIHITICIRYNYVCFIHSNIQNYMLQYRNFTKIHIFDNNLKCIYIFFNYFNKIHFINTLARSKRFSSESSRRLKTKNAARYFRSAQSRGNLYFVYISSLATRQISKMTLSEHQSEISIPSNSRFSNGAKVHIKRRPFFHIFRRGREDLYDPALKGGRNKVFFLLLS